MSVNKTDSIGVARPDRLISFTILLVLGCLPHLIGPSFAAGRGVEPFKFFREYVGLSENEISAIRSGKAVAKVLDSRTQGEVFAFGAVYVESTPEKYLELASDVDALRKLPSYLTIRKFSDPPQLFDLDGFTLGEEDIKHLKDCRPAPCEVQLPTSAMEAFQRSVNWSAPDVASQVNELARRMAIELLLKYKKAEILPWVCTKTKITLQPWGKPSERYWIARRRCLRAL